MRSYFSSNIITVIQQTDKDGGLSILYLISYFHVRYVASDPTLTFCMPRRSRRVLICTTYDNISLFI